MSTQTNKLDKPDFFAKIFNIEKPKNTPLPELICSKEIPSLIKFLQDEKQSIIEKLNILSTLKNLFKSNFNLIPAFMCKYLDNSKIYFFLEPLIDLYLNPKTQKEQISILEDLLKLILDQVSISKTSLEYIYQKLAKYFTNIENEILKEDIFLRYLNLLNIFYTDGHSLTVKNYIFFNGHDSNLSLSLNHNTTNCNADYPTLENGCSFVFWFYMNKNLVTDYYKRNPNNKFNFVVINIAGHVIKLILNDLGSVKVMADDTGSNIINIKTSLKFDAWNNLIFVINPKSAFNLTFDIYVNGQNNNSFLPLTKVFVISEKLNTIKYFENFLGRVTSVLFFSFPLSQKQINYFIKLNTNGFFKNKQLFQFFLNNDKEYLNNAIYNKYKSQIKVDKSIDIFNTQLKKQNLKNLMCFLCPFIYNKEDNTIDDIFGNFIGVLGPNDGVVNYKKYTRKIKYLGGMNNLLPIAELMYSSISKAKNIKYNFIDKSILTENTFLSYFNAIKQILIGHPKNLADANARKFFSSLGLFLEKFPSNVFTGNILDIFLAIGKESFLSIDNKGGETFVNMILLNEKIFSKFSKENQLKLWERVYEFFTSDYSQMRDSLNMTKICVLLRFYDENRYEEFCCLKHANLFKSDKDINYKPKIMNPEMNTKIEKVFNIIQLYIEKFYQEEETNNLFKLLSLDLSPCLQKKIIQVYISIFLNEKIVIDTKKKVLDKLLKEDFIEITEYVLSISMLDVRNEIIKLYKIIFENKTLFNLTKSHIEYLLGNNSFQNFHFFISDNLLPDQLIIETESEEKTENSKPKRLVEYFNNDIYNKDLEDSWQLLSEWTSIETILKQKNKTEINNILKDFVLNNCMLFVSRAPSKFVDLLIISFISFLKDDSINNKQIFFDNKNVYPWTIETIFYFYNKENEKDIKDTSNLKNIKTQSMILFTEFFINKKLKDDKKNFVDKANYIIKYSYKLKEYFIKEEIKINEISKITRMLIQKLIEICPKKLNDIIKLCLEFILLYKNSFNLSDIKKTLPDNLTLLSSSSYSIGSEMISMQMDLLPNYIYTGLFLNEENKTGVLKNIWYDFSLYDSIIDYYRANLWGIENLCKGVKKEYGGDTFKVCKVLLKEYGDSKSYRNLLANSFIKFFKIKIVEQKDNIKIIEEDTVNIFNIILVLLCAAIETTKDEDEKNFIVSLYQQYMIYLVLVSININPQEKYHDFIQEKIYDVLGFGYLFLNKKDTKKSDELKDQILYPIFEEIYNIQTKKGIGKLFSSKKNLFKDTAVCKLFQFVKESDINKNRQSVDPKIKLGIETISLPPANDINIRNTTKEKNILPETKFVVDFKGDIGIIITNIFKNNIINTVVSDNKNNDIEIFYKNVYSLPSIFEKQNLDEKKRINKKIKKLIPFFENQIKKYSNKTFLQEKKRRNKFKWSKTRLFSWRGFWSDRNLFYKHPEFLKLKQKNHLTKEMTMPLLGPVLDVNYYLPDFGKFDKNNLFNKNDYNYRISLDIDDILRDETDEKIDKLMDNNDRKKSCSQIEFPKNAYNFNYLECVYKLTYDELWEKYLSYYEEKFNFDKIILQNKEAYSMLYESKEFSTDDKLLKLENIYNCCIVKPTHHIIGYISTEQKRLKFIHDPDSRKNDTDESLENDPIYDRDMECCFGSTFKKYRKDQEKINFVIEYSNIRYMFLRNYYYIQSGIEIYTKTNKCYFLAFKTNKDCKRFMDDIRFHFDDTTPLIFREIKTEDYKDKKILGYELVPQILKNKIYSITSKMEDWQNRKISTVEYLMWLNIFAGRSFNDLTQYPVFPWIITNYDKEDFNIKTDFRNLNLPMGMLTLSEKGIARAETFQETYETIKADLKDMFPDFDYKDFLKKQDEYYDNYKSKKQKKNKNDGNILEINNLPYYYGSHYSNPTYISHYLSRTFPFAFVAIEIQGEKFDDPDRLFLSMNKTFISASSLKDDVRELIPEFYITPEIFMNKNNLNLSQGKLTSDNKILEINDVELPLWAKNNSYIFVTEMRKYLETGDIKLNKWIDLIFGNCQRGEKAEKNKNLFQAQSYENMVKISDIITEDKEKKDSEAEKELKERRNALMRLIELGVTPSQIYNFESKAKIDKKQLLDDIPLFSTKGKFIFESKKLYSKTIKSLNFNIIKTKHYENHKCSSNKDYYNPKTKELFYLKISKIRYLEHHNIRIFTNTNQWYNLKYSPSEKEFGIEESNINKIENCTNKYAISYNISHINNPIIIFDNGKYLIKGGFWDGRIELNSINNEPKEENISYTIFNNYGGGITEMCISGKEKFLLCGTKEGFLVIYILKNRKLELKNNLFIHSEPIISISVNDNLNMFATSSKDGYVMIHTMPKFNLVRSIHIPSQFDAEQEFLYADKVFLACYPLACIVLFISKRNLFRVYTLNGSFICDVIENENSKSIKCAQIFTDFDFQSYLIYGTDDGFVKIRKFPYMELVNSINPFNNCHSIETICLSDDLKYCFAYSSGNEIAVISDPSASGVKSVENSSK